MCFVNSQNVRDLRQPFGGTKASGTGREGGTWSYEVFCEPKNVAVSLGSASHPALGSLTMGKLALAAKITHVPSMYLSEFPGPNFGCREAAINGHKEIDRRCRELGVDTIVVFDVHWQVNSEYHINCGAEVRGHLHQQRAAALHQEHALRLPGQPGAGPPDRRHGQRDGREEPRPQRHHAGARVRHAGADALHERRPALQGDQHQRLVRLARPARIAAASASRCAARSRSATTARWRCSPAARCRTTSPTTAARRSSCTRSTTRSSSRWTAAWSSCGRPATGRPSAACCRCTPTSAGAKATCTTPRCCWACWAGTATTAPVGDRHALLRQLGHRADQRDLPGHAAARAG